MSDASLFERQGVDGHATARFVNAGHTRALTYWAGKRRGRLMPSKDDIVFDEIPDLLPFVLMIEVMHDPFDLRYRYVGKNILTIIVRDYTGTRLSELPGQGPGSTVWGCYAETVQRRHPCFTSIPYVGSNKYVQNMQDLQMPLSSDGQNVDMVFTFAAFIMKPGWTHGVGASES